MATHNSPDASAQSSVGAKRTTPLAFRSLGKGYIFALASVIVAVLLAVLDPFVVSDSGHLVMGLFFTASVVAALVVLTMSLYYSLRSRFAYSKYAVEFSFLALALALCFVVKFCALCALVPAEQPFLYAVATALDALYGGIGRFTFEGIAADGMNPLWQTLYYGASLYAGVVFLAIISAKASYEGYSFIQMLLMSPADKNVYVFTALNAETMQLALSLKQEGNVIVFAGTSLPAFDRHNELCRAVMANGFLYWSYSQTNEAAKRKSIAAMLHLNSRNLNRFEVQFVVFAFETDNHIPMEESNMNAVFTDIQTRIKGGEDNLRVEYYILTRREIAYQAYQSHMEELTAQCPNGKEWFYAHFVVNVWSEANTIAQQVTQYLHHPLLDESGQPETRVWSVGFGVTAQTIIKDLYVQSANLYSSQQDVAITDFVVDAFDPAATQLGGIFQYENPNVICVDVDAEFAALWTRCQAQFGPKIGAMDDEKRRRVKSLLKEWVTRQLFAKRTQLRVNDLRAACVGAADEGFDVRHVFENECKYLKIGLNSMGCNDYEFLDRIDRITGADCTDEEDVRAFVAEVAAQYQCNFLPPQSPSRPQYIVIATGDDYTNIQFANALVSDVLHEGKSQSKQVVFVNVWNDENNRLIERADGTFVEGNQRVICYNDDLYLVIVGNNTQIYTADGVLGNHGAKVYNYNYNRISDDFSKQQTAVDAIEEAMYANLTQGEPTEVERQLGVLFDMCDSNRDAYYRYLRWQRNLVAKQAAESLHDIVYENFQIMLRDSQTAWQRLDMWSRASSTSANAFAPVYRQLFDDFMTIFAAKGLTYTMQHLLVLEHQRWMRLHWANGWVYAPQKKKPLREHNCLVPTYWVPKNTYRYDLLNVMWAIKIGEKTPE